jgi:hypothetical protein
MPPFSHIWWLFWDFTLNFSESIGLKEFKKEVTEKFTSIDRRLEENSTELTRVNERLSNIERTLKILVGKQKRKKRGRITKID